MMRALIASDGEAVRLEPTVAGQELEKPRSLGSTPHGHSLTEEEIADVERKLWRKTGVERYGLSRPSARLPPGL
jgi:hypothetical protein